MAKINTLLFLMLILPIISHCSQNPYKTLAVGRSASQQEIKKAYKKLAREWHPDKTSDPAAADKFIQIQQAYEILSDDNKKREYDQFGYVDPNESHRRQQDPFGRHGHPFQHFDFGGGGGFRYSSNSRPSNAKRVTLNQLQEGILPQSGRKPYLLFLTGNFCFNCMNIEGLWSDLTAEIESLGVGMGTVNIDNDRRISSLLGIRYRPAIAGVVNGRVVDFGQGSVTLQALKDFIDRLLPRGLVQEVSNYNYQDFLASSYTENKPRILLYSTHARSPPLAFKVAALHFSEFQTFGFVFSRAPNTDQVQQHVEQSTNRGAVLIYKEDVSEPVDKLDESEMTFDSLNNILSSHKYLAFPRLSSQAIFEEMCPESPQMIGRRFCVVQITKATPEHEPFRASFKQIIMTTPSWPHEATMAYMLFDSQKAVASALEGLIIEVEHSVPVAVIWRLRGNQVRVAWLPDGWEGSDPSMERRGIKEFLYGLHDGTNSFSGKMVLPEFVNENAPAWYVQMAHDTSQKLSDWYRTAKDYIMYPTWDSSSLLALIMVIYMFFFVMAFFGIFSGGKGETEREGQDAAQNQRDGTRQQEAKPNELRQYRTPEGALQIIELGHHEYQNMIEEHIKSWQVILIATESSINHLGHHLSRELGHYPLRFQIRFVRIDRYRSWYQTLLPEKTEGTIIAMRPAKKHYCEFIPKSLVQSSNHEAGARRRNQRSNGSSLDAGFIGLSDSDDDHSRRDENANIFHGLTHWFDKLQDGNLPKTSVEDWPELK